MFFGTQVNSVKTNCGYHYFYTKSLQLTPVRCDRLHRVNITRI